MPCVVKCRCGKSTQKFNKLSADQIESYDCPKCPGQPHEQKAAPVPREQNNPFARSAKKKQPKDEAKAQEQASQAQSAE